MNISKYFNLFICILLLPTISFAKDKKKSDFQTYKGAWFDVVYPKSFSVSPSIESNTPNEYDSVFFISPDKKVKFYVYSPQWSGEATDIALNPSKEIKKGTKVETKNGVKYKWYTFESKDGSNFRSYQETTNEEETTRLIIGIEYSDKKSYNKYKELYLKFKKSIRQYAD